jgi:hypothetical protein
MSLYIPYLSEGFPPSIPTANRSGELQTSWDELLWAAITVGRPNMHYVFRHGVPSVYEALFRLSLIRMAVEQTSPLGWRLRRTEALKSLDPTEKGAVSYFLGMTVAKLFADRILNVPWLLHLDVFRQSLRAVLKERSRPDLVGTNGRGDWVALECKGRMSPPDQGTKAKAKGQAQRIISIMGHVPTYPIGAITFFKGDTLQFFWRDPPPEPPFKKAIRVPEMENAWQHYYRPVLELVRREAEEFERMRQTPILMTVPEADIKISVRPDVLEALIASQWDNARDIASGLPSVMDGVVYRGDGVSVVAGPSWSRPFEEVL